MSMTPLIVEAEKALSDLAIFKAAESQRVQLEVDLARMRAKKIELDFVNICEREKPEPLKAENLASYRPSVLGTVPAYHSQPARNSNPNADVKQAFPNGRWTV